MRSTLAGVQTFRKALAFITFEISTNGATLIGVLDVRGQSQIVHVDLATGTVGAPDGCPRETRSMSEGRS